MASSASSETSLLWSIIDYLSHLKDTNPMLLVDVDSLDAAVDCLRECTGFSDPNPNPLSHSLPQIFSAGITCLGATSAGIPPAAASFSSSADSDSFPRFVEMLKSKNFFDGASEGSPEWKVKMEAAKAKFEERHPGKTGSASTAPSPPSVSDEDRKAAESLKNEGNSYLTQQKYMEAVDSYTKAIALNPHNAIYFSNRAAANINMKNWNAAVEDSKKAVKIDPTYVKGYYRLGQSLMSLDKYKEAVDALQKAKDLAKNDAAMTQSVEEQLQKAKAMMSGGSSGGGGGGGGGGGFDLESLLSNPDLANLASSLGGGGDGDGGGMDFASLLNNPQIMNMAQQMFGGMGGGGGGGGAGGGGGGGGGGNKKPKSSPAPSSSPPSSSSSSSSGGGGGGGGGLPSNESIRNFMNSPAAQSLKGDPELAAAMEDIQKNGQGAIWKYLQNPNIMQKITSAFGPMMGNMGGGK